MASYGRYGGGGGFPEYVPVAERRRKAQASVEKLRKTNPAIAPVVITGKLVKTWWGKSWNDNLASYSDYANRIGRGRSYVRNGAVLDLQVSAGSVRALVQGSQTRPYQVDIVIQPLSKDTWETITKNCAGKFDSLQELIQGKFPKGLSELFTAKGTGLFPANKEIKLSCSCPDGAYMCKHVASALYGVGARLDEDPTLFFKLRNVNIDELISATVTKTSKDMLEKAKGRSRRVIDASAVSDVFGIDVN
jgi:uncharacterized Zn finger protein